MWQYHPQENIGYVDIDVNFIIGGAQGCHLYYWSNWEQKIIDPRRDLLEHGINTKCKSNGTLDKKKLYSFLSNPSLNPNRLYPIDLVCIMREGHKKEYFVCDDGHRRVSLAHKYELSKIKALVRVVYYDRG